MSKIIIKNISSLEKVLPLEECELKEYNSASALIGEVFSYQIAFKSLLNGDAGFETELNVVSDISECITVYNVRCVPVLTNHFYNRHDDDYICHTPALIPDYLEPYTDSVKASPKMFLAVWVSVKLNGEVKTGEHNIKIEFVYDGNVIGESNFKLDVIGAALPKLDIPCTDWFHSDCIASYHACDVFSERHLQLIKEYMSVARAHGINMILTPIFTPPLDTKIGSERPTIQLVDVFYENGVYTFGFEKLGDWLNMCREVGFEYIEVSHLYTQWGAEHTPKIIVNEGGRAVKKFGWETDSMGDEYKRFIAALLPPLTKYLEEHWDKNKVYFHISDEPSEKHIDFYGEIYKFVKPKLGEFKQMDAISDYEMYSKGFIDTPVVATSEISAFLDNKVENLWAYYCCGQGVKNLSNRFIAMPSYRNRILGLQLYKYDIKGFLHWGYNFYYSRLSTHLINPFLQNDCDYGFPAGDGFSVYPCQNGALPSLRLKIFFEALQDLMAAKLLERYIGKDAVLKLIEAESEITFTSYHLNAERILSLREIINQKIKENI